MTTTSTEISDVDIIKELKKNGCLATKVIHVTKPFNESSSDKDESSSDKNESSSDKNESSSDKNESSSDKNESSSNKNESSSDKKYSVVISEEGMLCFKSYVVWLITYESTSEGIIKITTVENKKTYSKVEEALGEAIDIELEIKGKTVDVSNEASDKKEETENVKEDDVKNILLVGRTGDGKSAIANVLVNNVDENKKPYFKESASGISMTKKATIVPFDHEKKKYKIIDTIGIGDTQLSFGEVLERIISAIHRVNYRLDHILFVTRGRMTREEIDTFNLLKSVIFCDKDDKGKFLLEEYTILVRSGFGKFENPDECRRDTELMSKESKEINYLINSCKGGSTTYVDNPPVYDELVYEIAEAAKVGNNEKVKELEKIFKSLKEERNLNINKRAQSRKILLKSLEESEKKKIEDHQKDHYEAKKMQELGERIIPLMNQIKVLKEILKEAEKNSDDDKTTKEKEELTLKKAYKKKKEDLEKRVLKEIKKYAAERGENEKDNVAVINTDEDENNQFTKTVGTTLISIGGIFMNAFVPGLGSELSQVLIGLIKSKKDE